MDIRKERRNINVLLANWTFPYDEEVILRGRLWELDNLPEDCAAKLDSLSAEYGFDMKEGSRGGKQEGRGI